MIPSENTILNDEFEVEELPSKNYKMHIKQAVINGYNDTLEAMKQVVYKILNTERYQYEIYSWDYGIELNDLFGESVDYVCIEAERRIKEALLQDDRIRSVDNFSFDTSEKRKVLVSFTVHTIFGDIESEKGVNF